MLRRTRSWWWFKMRSDLNTQRIGDRPRCRFGLPATAGVATGILLVAALVGADETKHPVFVGASECAKCHQGAGFGYQQCLMLLQAHSKAYATLAMPEAKEIARLSGIPQEPQEAAMCLGCHATGSEAEDWEKDDTFHLEDGVQCEKCHGAGSEYMEEEIMTDPAAARAAGLMMPQKSDCMNCHKVKGSHAAVLAAKKYDIDEAWELLKHPSPEKWEIPDEPTFPAPADAQAPKHVGSNKCGECHKSPAMGYQYSQWRMSPHAYAYARLGTPRARTRGRIRCARRPAHRSRLPQMPHDRLSRSRRRTSRFLYARRGRRLRSLSRCRQPSSPWKP